MAELLASASGRLETLQTLRDRLASDIDGCVSARDVAALSQRLMDVLEQIADVEAEAPPTKGTVLDELEQRRSTKPAAGKGRATGAGKRR